MDGFIQLHRKLIEWEWYTDIPVKTLFIHCLLMANFKAKKWQGNNIKRGSFITSRNKLSLQTGLSEQQVRTALKKLLSTKDITKQNKGLFTLISIVNYNSYQGVSTSNITREQPGSNQGATTTNKDNKDNKDNDKAFVSPSLDSVKSYFKEKGYKESIAIKAFEYYNVANWKDSKGKKVKNWKQKMNAVWFKEENKEPENFNDGFDLEYYANT